MFLNPWQTKFLGGLYRSHPFCPSIYPNTLSVRPSIQMSCQCNSSLVDHLVLMKLCTIAVYNPWRCMKRDNHGLKYFKGEISGMGFDSQFEFISIPCINFAQDIVSKYIGTHYNIILQWL